MDKPVTQPKGLRRWFMAAFKPGAVLDVRSVRREALPYFAGWIIVFTWLYCAFLPNESAVLSATANAGGYESAANYVWLLVCPLIAVFSRGVDYVPKTVYSVATAIVCYIAALLFDAVWLSAVMKLVMSVCVGHIFASCGYGFFIVLNNAEKFYSMLLSVLLPKLILCLNAGLTENMQRIGHTDLTVLCCLIGLAICTAFFVRGKPAVPVLGRKPFPAKAWSLTAMVFPIFAFNDVIAPAVLSGLKANCNYPLHIWYFAGVVFGLMLIMLLQKGLKLNICLMLNISMAFLSMGFVIGMAIKDFPDAAIAVAVCLGAAYGIGMVNIYYLAGFMVKKLQNVVFYRVGIILSSAYYFFGFGTVWLFGSSLPVISAISLGIVIVFFALSPVFQHLLYDREWIDDSYRQDVTFESRLRTRLKELRLSPKEIEVCELLLQGYTLRQTAAMLEIAYPTANTYCTSVYRKLKINSRAELTLLLKEYIG